MKKIAVCGCSFMWSSKPGYELLAAESWPDFPIDFESFPDRIRDELTERNYKHWPSFIDICALEKNFKIAYFSEGGCSNFGIRLQIDKAIEDNPDFVVIGATEPNRFEIATGESDFLYSTKRIKTPEIELAIRHYISIQNEKLCSDKSYFFLQSGLEKLQRLNIPFLFIPGPMRHQDWTDYTKLWPLDKLQPWDLAKTSTLDGNHMSKQNIIDLSNIMLDIIQDWN